MMLPRPRSRMRGATVLVSTKAPTRLMRSTSAKSAALISRRAERRRTAAEFTSTSTPPYSARAEPTSCATSASLPTSPLTAVATPPAWEMAVTVSARGSGRRPKMTTRAPSLANSSAVARPMPVPPPATMVTLPSSVFMLDAPAEGLHGAAGAPWLDRKSTRLNSSHLGISYAVFCLKKITRRPHRRDVGTAGPDQDHRRGQVRQDRSGDLQGQAFRRQGGRNLESGSGAGDEGQGWERDAGPPRAVRVPDAAQREARSAKRCAAGPGPRFASRKTTGVPGLPRLKAGVVLFLMMP